MGGSVFGRKDTGGIGLRMKGSGGFLNLDI
jgi:hypothetical protein